MKYFNGFAFNAKQCVCVPGRVTKRDKFLLKYPWLVPSFISRSPKAFYSFVTMKDHPYNIDTYRNRKKLPMYRNPSHHGSWSMVFVQKSFYDFVEVSPSNSSRLMTTMAYFAFQELSRKLLCKIHRSHYKAYRCYAGFFLLLLRLCLDIGVCMSERTLD